MAVGTFRRIRWTSWARFIEFRRHSPDANQRRPVRPPRIDPSAPRRIARPTLDPTDRAALFAAASSRPSWWPPRGPVVPNRMEDRPADAPVVVGALVVVEAGAGVAVPAFPGSLADVRDFSFSYADSRSTACW